MNSQEWVLGGQAAYLDFQLLILEELLHLSSSLLLTEGGLSHNVKLLFQCSIVGPGLLDSTKRTHIHRQCLIMLRLEW